MTLPSSTGGHCSACADIAAERGRVWQVLEDRAAWLPGFISLRSVAGAPGSVGERRLQASGDRACPALRLEETLLLQPTERCVIRLAAADDTATWAIADWRLQSSGSGTRLSFEVYWFETAAPGSADALQELGRQVGEQTAAMLQAHLQRIKRAAEAAST